MFNINKKGKIATLMAFILVLGIVGSFVFAAPKLCNNGKDDDNDGLIDYPNDPGCNSRNDNLETSVGLICDDNVEQSNDADNLKDFRLSGGDPGCISATDTSEIDGVCDDTLDSPDRDTLINYPSDAGCSSYSDSDETDGMCDDNIDDASDLDVLADASDPGCSSFSDTTEIGQCEDSLDNDGDGFIDYLYLDSKCTSYGDDDESPRDYCNDSDGGININVAGNITGEDESISFTFFDTCVDTTYLTEYYCGWYSQDYAPLSTNRSCAGNATTMCSAGRCV